MESPSWVEHEQWANSFATGFSLKRSTSDEHEMRLTMPVRLHQVAIGAGQPMGVVKAARLAAGKPFPNV